MPSIAERLGITPYPTIMRQRQPAQDPLSKLQRFNQTLQNQRAKVPLRSSSSSTTRSSSAPNLPTIEESIANNQQQIQNAINELLKSYNPRPIPTFSPAYYMPQNTLNLINQARNQQFSPSPQLREVAQRQVSLLTNPQIEALRTQINALKALVPQTQQQINQNYSQAQSQIGQNVSNIVSQIVEQTQLQGGLRPGVYTEISNRAYQNMLPISDTLENQRQLDIQTILGQLQAQKDSATNLLNTIQANRENMEEMQYNTLVDQAQQQFNQAQQSQLQILMQLAGMEQSARGQAASMEQERVINYNNMLQQMLNTRLQGIEVTRRQQEQELQQQYDSNIQAWMDYLYNPSVRTNADAYNLLMRSRPEIEATVGIEGFLQLQNQIGSTPPNQVNPSFRGSANTVPNPRISNTATSPVTALNQGIGFAFSSSNNPILRALGNLIR